MTYLLIRAWTYILTCAQTPERDTKLGHIALLYPASCEVEDEAVTYSSHVRYWVRTSTRKTT